MTPKRESFNKLMVTKRDIFKTCTQQLPQYKMFLFGLIHGIIIQLEKHIPLLVFTKNFIKVTQVVANVGSVGIRLDWLDRAINEMHEGKNSNNNIRRLQP